MELGSSTTKRLCDRRSSLARATSTSVLALLVVGVLYAPAWILYAPAWIQETWAKATYKPLVTREMYRKIRPGMTVAQVQAIIGAKGEQSGQGSNLSALKLTVGMNMAQIQAVRNSPEAQTQNQPWEFYEWKNPPPWVTYLKVLFVNGYATEITEHGLQ